MCFYFGEEPQERGAPPPTRIFFTTLKHFYYLHLLFPLILMEILHLFRNSYIKINYKVQQCTHYDFISEVEGKKEKFASIARFIELSKKIFFFLHPFAAVFANHFSFYYDIRVLAKGKSQQKSRKLAFIDLPFRLHTEKKYKCEFLFIISP